MALPFIHILILVKHQFPQRASTSKIKIFSQKTFSLTAGCAKASNEVELNKSEYFTLSEDMMSFIASYV